MFSLLIFMFTISFLITLGSSKVMREIIGNLFLICVGIMVYIGVASMFFMERTK